MKNIQKNILRLLLVGAEDVINNPESTQEEIDSAIAAIKETLNGFNNSANNSNNNNDNNINDNTNNDINKEEGNNNFIVPAIIISITIVIVGVSIILFARKKV